MNLARIQPHLASAADFLTGATKFSTTPAGLAFARASLVSAKKCIDRAIAAIDSEREKARSTCS